MSSGSCHTRQQASYQRYCHQANGTPSVAAGWGSEGCFKECRGAQLPPRLSASVYSMSKKPPQKSLFGCSPSACPQVFSYLMVYPANAISVVAFWRPPEISLSGKKHLQSDRCFQIGCCGLAERSPQAIFEQGPELAAGDTGAEQLRPLAFPITPSASISGHRQSGLP